MNRYLKFILALTLSAALVMGGAMPPSLAVLAAEAPARSPLGYSVAAAGLEPRELTFALDDAPEASAELGLPETLDATLADGEETTLPIAEWAPAYEKKLGTQSLTPLLPKGYGWADGVAPPTVTVTISRGVGLKSINDRYIVGELVYKEVSPTAVQLIGHKYGFDAASGVITVPESITVPVNGANKTFAVTSIGSLAFSSSEITGIVFPEGLVSIESDAFGHCSSLTGTITFPSTVTSIGSSAFAFSGITGLVLPEGLEFIGTSAFRRCTSLTGTLTIPSTVQELGIGAFDSTGITGLVLQEGLKTIGANAFYSCASLTGTVTIPSTMREIDANAFGFSGITGLVLQEGLVSVGSDAFFNCASLTGTVTIPSTVTSIGENAFFRSGITGLVLPEGLASIERSAFSGCASLTGTVTIPSTVTSIGDNAFLESGITGLVLQEGLVSIGGSAFRGCASLAGTLTIPSTVTSIGASAFTGTAVTQFTVANNVVAELLRDSGIDQALIRLPDGSAPSIPPSVGIHFNADGLFYRVTGASEAALLGFFGSPGLTLTIPPVVSHGGVNYTVTAIADNAFSHSSTLTGTVTIPSTVREIGAYAFSSAAITGLVLQEGLVSVGEGAFNLCVSLTGTVTIPSTVRKIDNYTFQSAGVTGLVLHEGLASIGDFSFEKCQALTGTVTIPSTVTSIGRNAFLSSEITGVVLPEGLETIGDFAFMHCNSLTGTLTIPSTVTAVGDGVFYSTGITGLVLPTGLASIGDSAFDICDSLTGTLNIPATVTSIGRSAFGLSIALDQIIIEGKLDHLGGNAFDPTIPVHCAHPETQLLLVSVLHMVERPTASWDGSRDVPAGAIVSVDTGIIISGNVTIGDGAVVTINDGGSATIASGGNLTVVGGGSLTVASGGSIAVVGGGSITGSGSLYVEGGGALTGVSGVTPVYQVSGVSLDKTTLLLETGDSATLTATVSPVNATDSSITWRSSDPDIATVNENGNVTAVGVGNATITATTTDGGKEASCNVNVTNDRFDLADSFLETPIPDQIYTGNPLQPPFALLQPTGGVIDLNLCTIVYSNNVQVGTASISVVPAPGVSMKGQKLLSFRIIPDPGGHVPVASVSLHPEALSLKPGTTGILTPTLLPEHATNQAVTWRSSSPAVATVDSGGRVTAVSPGSATITVTTVDGGHTATCAVTVSGGGTGNGNLFGGGSGIYSGSASSGSSGSRSRSRSDSPSAAPSASSATANTASANTLTPAAMEALASAARESGLKDVRSSFTQPTTVPRNAWSALAGLRYIARTTSGGAVQVQITFPDPSAIRTDLQVSGWVQGSVVDSRRAFFEKWFRNPLRVIHFDHSGAWGQTIRVAAKIDLSGMDPANLCFYSYNKATNSYRRIERPNCRLDENSYLHFDTSLAGDIVISDGPLERR